MRLGLATLVTVNADAACEARGLIALERRVLKNAKRALGALAEVACRLSRVLTLLLVLASVLQER